MRITTMFKVFQHAIAIAFIGWLVFSYADILAHNDLGEEHCYSPINAIVLGSDFVGEVIGIEAR